MRRSRLRMRGLASRAQTFRFQRGTAGSTRRGPTVERLRSSPSSPTPRSSPACSSTVVAATSEREAPVGQRRAPMSLADATLPLRVRDMQGQFLSFSTISGPGVGGRWCSLAAFSCTVGSAGAAPSTPESSLPSASSRLALAQVEAAEEQRADAQSGSEDDGECSEYGRQCNQAQHQETTGGGAHALPRRDAEVPLEESE